MVKLKTNRSRIISYGLQAVVLITLVLVCLWLIRNNAFDMLISKQTRITLGPPKAIYSSDKRFSSAAKILSDHTQRVERKEADGSYRWIIFYEKDIDGDGRKDRIESYSLGISINTTKHHRYCARWLGSSGAGAMGFDDIDSDGHLDAWWVDSGDDYLQIFWGDGKGCFVGKQTFSFNGIHQGAFLDLDSDGDLDFIFKKSRNEKDIFWWSENTTTHTLTNRAK